MDVQKAHQLLLALDEAYEVTEEMPEAFDYEREVAGVRDVCRLLEAELGVSLVVCTKSAQDSFFFAEVLYPAVAPFSAGVLLDIRFSSFGKLVSSWVKPGVPSSVPCITTVVHRIVENHGYNYIDFTWLLGTKYDGIKNKELQGTITWWERFFDYT